MYDKNNAWIGIACFIILKSNIILNDIARNYSWNSVDDSQGAAADAEAKGEELSRAVEELHKLLQEAGEGKQS